MFARIVVLLPLLLVSVGCRTIPKPNDGPTDKPTIYGEEIEGLDLLEGDIVLRAGIGPDSDLIRALTGSPWSHSGIIVKDGTEKIVVDNLPGRSGGSIGKSTVEEFFSQATSGGVWRYWCCKPTPALDRIVPTAAAAWAEAQIGAGYTFDLLDPYTNNDKKQYCSEFVWRAFRHGGDDLVPSPLFLKGVNLARTRQTLIKYAKAEASFFEKAFVPKEVDKHLDPHIGLFIAPGQLDTAYQTAEIK